MRVSIAAAAAALTYCTTHWIVSGAGPVTAVAFSENLERLATVSEDGTAFLFACAQLGDAKPLGYVQLPAVATAAAWTARPAQLVVTCRCGPGHWVKATSWLQSLIQQLMSDELTLLCHLHPRCA